MRAYAYLVSLFLFFSSCGENEIKFEPFDDYHPLPEDITNIDGLNDTFGKITDETGQPVEGVVVSDGENFAVTDVNGVYQFKRATSTKFVYYSNPSGYEVNTESSENKMAHFYKKLLEDQKGRVRIDFKLKKSNEAQTNFMLFAIGDPQVANNDDVTRYRQETLPDMKEVLHEHSLPAIGLSLGDVTADNPSLNLSMKSIIGSAGLPVFTTVGNHDKVQTTGSGPKVGDGFENVFGPSNYSFNYGDVHFVCLDNVKFSNGTDYTIGLSIEQLNWLEKDLTYVDKSKLLIVYYHMPVRNSNFTARNRFFELISQFSKVHLMAGHTHYNQNYIHTANNNMYEHIHGATCGAWWKSTINGDGTPNGYAVYEVKGNDIQNWYYKSVRYPKEFQLRLHRGDASFGGSFSTHKFNLASDVLVANVWNADPNWRLEVFENNVKTGEMTLSNMNKDAWSMGYHLGVLNRDATNYTTNTTHLYTFKLQNPLAQIKVVATDRFGTTYEANTITTTLDAAIGY